MTHGLFGIRDVCLSVPRVVGAEGAGDSMVADLDDDEVQGLRNSARVVREVIDQVGDERHIPVAAGHQDAD
jgi:L-lactate dehydrogenase